MKGYSIKFKPYSWDAELALPSAFYDFALVVHRINLDASETHSDARLVGPIYVAAICSAVILYSKIRSGKPNVTAWSIASAAMFYLVFK